MLGISFGDKKMGRVKLKTGMGQLSLENQSKKGSWVLEIIKLWVAQVKRAVGNSE